MRRSRFRIGVILAGVIVAGCGGDSLNIGSNDGGVVADVAPLPMLPLGPISDAGDTKQVWIGHLEKDQFTDGSNTLTVTIDFVPGGQVTGSILLGDGARLAPPTDPNVGYPPGNTGVATLVEGFPYTIMTGNLDTTHLAVQFSEYEVWTQWCALQTSYPVSPCGGLTYCADADASQQYDCLALPPGFDASDLYVDLYPGGGPNGCGYSLPDGGFFYVDCGKFWFCGDPTRVCLCSAAQCRVSDSGPDVSLDLVLMNTKASGGLSGSFGDYPVQFTRSQ